MKASIDLGAAKWIWNDSSSSEYNYYLEAQRQFRLGAADYHEALVSGLANLCLTADSFYQVWLNDQIVGHGPAKSAEGRRFVDTYNVISQLRVGENILKIVVLSIGTGTMTYCPGDPGLIFRLSIGKLNLVSDRNTQVRQDPARTARTGRRWMLPCLEKVDFTVESTPWAPACEIKKDAKLSPRLVALPTREPLLPKRFVISDSVAVPNISVSFRLRPYLVSEEQRTRNNVYIGPAFILTDLQSPCAQELELSPTLGALTWYFRGEPLFELLQGCFSPRTKIKLRKGSNLLVGVARFSHLEESYLAGTTAQPIKVVNPFGEGGFQVLKVDEVSEEDLKRTHVSDWKSLRPRMPKMDPTHTAYQANAHDIVAGAVRVETDHPLPMTPSPARLQLPAPRPGTARRTVLDIGVVQNGWISFDAIATENTEIVLGFCESVDESAIPLKLQLTIAFNNALTCRLAKGWQSFESFLPYGARYISIHQISGGDLQIDNLRLLTANCGSLRLGQFMSNDLMLNRIADMCAQTVISGLDDTYTDCPTFEQVNWNFDNRTAAMGEALLCGNRRITENSIRLFAEDPRYTGLVRSQYPSTWDDYIPLWSFHWIMWCWEYIAEWRDQSFAEKVWPQIERGISDLLEKRNRDGLIEWPGVWHFVEWGQGRDDNHAINGAEQAGAVGALQAAERIIGFVRPKDTKALSRIKEARLALIAAINKQLWIPARQAYADSKHEDGTLSSVSSETTNAMMVLYGIATGTKARIIIQKLRQRNTGLLTCGSPYGMYYVLEAFDLMGLVDEIFTRIKHRWGAMIMAGDQTTWESFAEANVIQREPEFGAVPTRSRCHPFAAYVYKYFVKYIFGFDAAAPSAQVKPRPPQGVDYAYGTVTWAGKLHRISWKRERRLIRVLNS